MAESKRRAVQFREKEIKTYIALALFLSKEGFRERLQVGGMEVVIGLGVLQGQNARGQETRK